MHDSPPQALLLMRRETEEMFAPYLDVSNNCYSVINDIMNGLISVPDKENTLSVLCEYVAACKLTKVALKQIFIEKNMIKEQQYQVDSFQVETLKSSWVLLRALDFELLSANLTLRKH